MVTCVTALAAFAVGRLLRGVESHSNGAGTRDCLQVHLNEVDPEHGLNHSSGASYTNSGLGAHCGAGMGRALPFWPIWPILRGTVGPISFQRRQNRHLNVENGGKW